MLHQRPSLAVARLLIVVAVGPQYAEPHQWNETSYTAYVDKFVSEMAGAGAGPDVLCEPPRCCCGIILPRVTAILPRTGADYYPFFEFPSGSNLSTSIAGYRAALGVLRSASLRANVPFWNVRHVTLPRFDRACRSLTPDEDRARV